MTRDQPLMYGSKLRIEFGGVSGGKKIWDGFDHGGSVKLQPPPPFSLEPSAGVPTGISGGARAPTKLRNGLGHLG
jgi:hypothetical protein